MKHAKVVVVLFIAKMSSLFKKYNKSSRTFNYLSGQTMLEIQGTKADTRVYTL